MKKPTGDFARKVLHRALHQTPRRANNEADRKSITADLTDRNEVRAILATHLANAMPPDAAFAIYCTVLDTLRSGFFEAQRQRQDDAVNVAIMAAMQAIQRQLADMGPIVSARWKDGRLLARPVLFSPATMADPDLRAKIRELEVKHAVLTSMVSAPRLRSFRDVAGPWADATEVLLQAAGRDRAYLRNRIMADLMPLVSGETTEPETVRKAIEAYRAVSETWKMTPD